MPVKTIRNIFAESYAGEPVHLHDILKSIGGSSASFSEIAFRIADAFVELICLSVSLHVYSAYMETGSVQVFDEVLIARQILCHSVADLNDALYLSGRRRIVEPCYLCSVSVSTVKNNFLAL